MGLKSHMTGLEKETRLGQGNGLGARSQEYQWFRKGDRVSLLWFFELLLKIDREKIKKRHWAAGEIA